MKSYLKATCNYFKEPIRKPDFKMIGATLVVLIIVVGTLVIPDKEAPPVKEVAPVVSE